MNKIIVWAIALLTVMYAVYLLSDTLVPFILSFVFAYLLQPAIEANCTKFKLHRSIVTTIIFTLFMSGFIAIIVIFIPLVYKQFTVFIHKIPQYKTNFEILLLQWSEKLHEIDPEIAEKVKSSGYSVINNIFGIFSSLANYAWDGAMATINFFVILSLIPIILYYFLRDWPEIVSSVESLLPRRGKSKVRKIFIDINELLSAYIRGQLNICFMLSFYYSMMLTLMGLDLALLLGVVSGFFIIIPFIGPFLSFFLVMLSSYIAFGFGKKLLYIAILFLVGMLVEGYILTPKIIGDRIGLHPVWVIFAVIAAGSLFGFLGILLAIPLAGVVKVCLSYLIEYYKNSDIYKL